MMDVPESQLSIALWASNFVPHAWFVVVNVNKMLAMTFAAVILVARRAFRSASFACSLLEVSFSKPTIESIDVNQHQSSVSAHGRYRLERGSNVISASVSQWRQATYMLVVEKESMLLPR